MSVDLIQTKLTIPPSRANLVQRERLNRRLDDSVNHKLTLITAPAGFGKSTLLSHWVEHNKLPIAWYTLDGGDNDPDHFLSYLLTAMHTVAPNLQLAESAAALRQAQEATAIETLLTFLINEFQQLKQPVGIVLDDYHLIQNTEVDAILTFLLDRAPPSIYILLASRKEPGFNYAKLRASDQLLELDEHDLRFTPEETSLFLREVMGLQISAEEVASLEERTEGWIAGLQLAALSLEGRADVSNFITSLRGTDRFILDYLAEEVFARLPEVLQSFILRISLVERFNAALCDTLIEDWEDATWEKLRQDFAGMQELHSRPILEFLDSSNLFVVPLDHGRQWYRFHHLFGEFLRDRLSALHPGEIPELHRRASTWFSSQRFLTEAIQHALLAGEPDVAATLIKGQVKPLLSSGETRTLTRWIEALPEETLVANPTLLIGQIWSYLLNDPVRYQAEIQQTLGQFSYTVAVTPDSIQQELARPDLDPEKRDLLGQYALLLAFLGRDNQPHEVTIELFRLADSVFSPDDFFTRAIAHSGLASTYARQGNLTQAEQAFVQAAQLGQQSDSSFVYLVAKDWEATVQTQRGQLNRAATTFQAVIDQLSLLASERLPLTAHAYVGLATVLLEQNDLDRARECVEMGIDRGHRIFDRDALLDGYPILARILHSQRDPKGSQQAMQRGLQEAQKSGSEQCMAEVEARAALLNLAEGDIPAAIRWAKAHNFLPVGLDDAASSLLWIERLALARLRLAQGDLPLAEAILKNMLTELEDSEFAHLTMEVRCALSVVLQAGGDRESAQRIVSKTLLKGEPEGFMRCFLDQGPRMAALLRRVASSGHSSAYIEHLLEAFGESLSEDEPIEPLTERELEVLRLLSEGLTNTAIAEELVIAQSTVKTHINHIYAKLGVTQRTQAVARARELHLLS